MIQLLIFLSLGWIISAFVPHGSLVYEYNTKFTNFIIYFLLVIMGMSTGQQEGVRDIFTNLGQISFLLAFFGMLGSVLLTMPMSLYIKKNYNSIITLLFHHYKNQKYYHQQKIVQTQDNNVQYSLNNHISNENLIWRNNFHRPKKTKWQKFELIFPLIFYLIGLFVSMFFWKINADILSLLTIYTLYVLLFLSGVEIGRTKVLEMLRHYHIIIILLPLVSLLGSLLGGVLVNYWFGLSSLRACLAINAGMGYYSIATVINKTFMGDRIGIITLLTNLFREFGTMLLCYFWVRIFGPLAPIACGGVTTMDTTLPVIKKNAGAEYTLIALFNGIILTILVPIILSFIAQIHG